jgi:putative peptidoglycan lipid II flippase
LAVLPIAEVTDYDPAADGGNGEENPDQVALAVDEDPQTAWTTLTYYDDPDLANLKPGVGLVVDLGSRAAVGEVKVALVGTGTDLQLRAAPRTATTVPATAAEFAIVAKEQDAGERAVLRPEETVTTRFLLVYLTSLPLEVPGSYKGGIADLTVRG